MPPTFFHFTWLLSELFFNQRKNKFLFILPYLISAVILVVGAIWVNSILSLKIYLLMTYLFWLGRLAWILNAPRPQLERALVRLLLFCQLIGFLLPVLIVIAIRIWVPFNWEFTVPLILLFPLSLFGGLILGERQQQQTYLVQSEKRIAFGSLLAGLSHELNNPLTFIYSALEPLRESHQYLKSRLNNPDEETEQYFQELEKIVNNMERGVERAKGILKQFNEFPASRSKEKQEVNLEELLDRSIDLLSHKWKDRIQVQRHYDGIAKIIGREVELAQAFTNLLSNAFDASPDGGVVTVASHQVAGGVKVTIRDTGAGISRAVLGKIFDPFFTTKGQGEGTGLGLAITLQIIKNHRGSIEVISEPEQGTEFLIYFPH